MGIKPGTIDDVKIFTDEDGTLVVDINKLSPRESIEFIDSLKEKFDVKFIGRG